MPCQNLKHESHPAGGTLVSFLYCSNALKPGTTREVTVYIPSRLEGAKEFALQIYLDGMRACEPAVLEKLLADSAIPPLVTIGVKAASLTPLVPRCAARSVRSIEYDSLGSAYADFLINELIPEITQFLPKDSVFSASPDMHAICGCSSGGICSWNACWERNDYFRRCLINSPTFSSFRGGEEFIAYLRKYETKPIRCFMTAGTDDMKNSAGNWYLEALSAKEAMEYAGYEYVFECFQDGQHGVGSGDADVMERGLRFIWQDWDTKPVGIRHLPERVADIIAPNSPWFAGTLPHQTSHHAETPYGNYSSDEVANALKTDFTISGIVLSCDHTRLYLCSREKRFVYACRIAPDGSLHDLFPCARLHIADDFKACGGFSLCIDEHGRLYVATELGIQTFSCEGHSNCILPLPHNEIPCDIGFAVEHPGTLCAKTLAGHSYHRHVLTRAASSVNPSTPDSPRF